MGAIEAARQILGDLEREVGGPPAIVQIVVVEVDRRIVLGASAPHVFATVPASALHRTGGQVDELTVAFVARDVDDTIGGDLAGEVEVRNDRAVAPDLVSLLDPCAFCFCQCIRADPRRFELAVEVRGRRRGAPARRPRRETQRCSVRDGDLQRRLTGGERGVTCVANQRRLRNPKGLVPGVDTGGDEVPVMREHRHRGRDLLHPDTVAQAHRERAARIEEKAVTALRVLAPVTQDRLLAVARESRPDQRLEGERR